MPEQNQTKPNKKNKDNSIRSGWNAYGYYAFSI